LIYEAGGRVAHQRKKWEEEDLSPLSEGGKILTKGGKEIILSLRFL